MARCLAYHCIILLKATKDYIPFNLLQRWQIKCNEDIEVNKVQLKSHFLSYEYVKNSLEIR